MLIVTAIAVTDVIDIITLELDDSYACYNNTQHKINSFCKT